VAYIIDGNNVMGQTVGWHRDKSGSRRALLVRVADFVRIKKTRVTVVFDGAPEHTIPDGSALRGVKILYAEKGSDADSRIHRLVEDSSNPKGLTVVTSDRHLAFLVRARGARVIRSGEFRRMLDQLADEQPKLEDGEQVDIGDVDQWMRYFGSLPQDD